MIHLYSNDYLVLNQELCENIIYSNKDFIIHSQCPHCGNCELVFYGHYNRTVILPDGRKETIRIQRCRCNHCHSVHSILTSSIIPYFLYTFITLIKMMNKNTDSIIDDSYRLKLTKRLPLRLLKQQLSYSSFLEVIHSALNNRNIFYNLLALPT